MLPAQYYRILRRLPPHSNILINATRVYGMTIILTELIFGEEQMSISIIIT